MSKEVSTLLNYAYFYLRFRPRTESEIRQYLIKKAKKFSYGGDIIDATVADLKKQTLIDDTKFVTWFVELKGSSAKKSRSMMSFQLMRHGVPQEIISAYFEDNEVDEMKNCRSALASQWRRFEKVEKRKRFEKAAAFLQRKGFSYGTIKRAIAEKEEKE